MRGDLYLKEMIELRGVPGIELDSIGTLIISMDEPNGKVTKKELGLIEPFEDLRLYVG